MSTRGIHENPYKHWAFCTFGPHPLSYLTAYRVRTLYVVVYRALWKGSCVSRPSPRHPRPCRTCQVVAIGFFLLANSGDVDRPPDLRPPERLTPICNADLATTMTPCLSVSPGNSGDVDRPASARNTPIVRRPLIGHEMDLYGPTRPQPIQRPSPAAHGPYMADNAWWPKTRERVRKHRKKHKLLRNAAGVT